MIEQEGTSVLADIPKTRDCTGILSADRVLIFTAQPPPGSKRRWQAALPFIAEEHTLTDPDDIHATHASGEVPGTIAVCVVTKSWLKQIISATAAAGLPLRRVVCETLLPALQADAWTLVWDGCSGFLRTSATTGIALDCGDQTTPPLSLTLSLTSQPPQLIELRLSGSETVAPQWDMAVPLVLGETWSWQHAAINGTTPNLLSGDLSPPLRLLDGLKKLRPALYILLAALFVEMTGSHIEWAMLSHEKTLLNQQIVKIYRATFGDENTLVDATLQMQRNLAALRHAAGVADNSDFLSLLDNSSQSLSSLGAGSIHSLSYESGKLELDLKLSNPAGLLAAEQQLKQNGLRVRTSDMHDSGDGTQAKLTLSAEGLR